jgi:hypothetical protein
MVWLGYVLDHWGISSIVSWDKDFSVLWGIQTASRVHQAFLYTAHLGVILVGYSGCGVKLTTPIPLTILWKCCHASYPFVCTAVTFLSTLLWCTCPAWMAFAGVLVKWLVFLCTYCYLCVTYWASWRLVNCLHSLHEMGRICFKILDWYKFHLLYESYLEFIFRL